jgi:hypothetical protein
VNSEQSKGLLAKRLGELETLVGGVALANRRLSVSGAMALCVPQFADPVLWEVVRGAINWDGRLSRDGTTVLRLGTEPEIPNLQPWTPTPFPKPEPGTEPAEKELLAISGPGTLPKPQTPSPEPLTRNQQPETLNPKPSFLTPQS